MYLRKWEADEEDKLDDFKAIPLWVKLYGIPLQYWTNIGFIYLSNFFGVPLYADGPALQASRILFARICVVMDVEGDFPESFKVKQSLGMSLRWLWNIVGIQIRFV